jgi:UDP-N-acetylglucosamine--N-acetylmuramyl-(pentapeptide) pyrophosphoryl-undecaprenol N-acetylglucosamine transferase
MDYALAAADIVISRAGAITLSELAATGKAAVLIPSPNVAENHQFKNAMAVKGRGAAEVFEDKNLNEKAIAKEIEKIIENKELVKELSNNASKNAIIDANEKIYSIIKQIL